MARFDISLTPMDLRVVIDGVDISSSVRSVYVTKDGMTVPQVALELLGEDVIVTGEGTISGGNPIVDFLEQIDPKELATAVAARSSFVSSPTVTTLDILKERADPE